MHFSWFHQIPALQAYPDHVLAAFFCTGLIIIFSLVAYSVAGTPEAALIPNAKPSLRGFFEVVVESLENLVDMVMGHDGKVFVPIIGSLFLYLIVNNFLGLFPGFVPATQNTNTGFACGLLIFVLYNVAGLKANGVNYLKHFAGPVIWLAPMFVVIELFSHAVRPVSLGLRLAGNMTGDHTVLSLFIGLTPYGVPMIFYLLGMFVCFVQAFVFSLLSMVYLSMATAHDH